MVKTTIRPELPGDVPSIRDVNKRAFGQSEEADIVDRIRESGADSLSLVATAQDRVVGHILFSPANITCEGRLVRGVALGPMAVLPQYQRQGIGSKLVQAGISEMQGRRCPFVVLVGHPEFYPRFGFEPASRRGIRCEWEVPDDVFMVRVLSEADMQDVAGLVRYHPEFAGD